MILQQRPEIDPRNPLPAADADFPRRIVVAAVALQSSPQTGTAVVKAEIRDGDAVKVARTIEVTFEPLKSSEVIEIRAASHGCGAVHTG